MLSKGRIHIALLAAILIVLAVGASPQNAGKAQTLAPAQLPGVAGLTIPYPGYLNNDAGVAVPDGAYDFIFTIYASQTGGEPVWMEKQGRVAVSGGAFAVSLGGVTPIPKEVLKGGNRWLEVAVRGSGEDRFTTLAPRQVLRTTTPASTSSRSSGSSCAHDHVGEVWNASLGWSNSAFKVNNSLNGPSIWGVNTGGGNALRADGYGTSIGLYAEGADESGVVAVGRGSYAGHSALRVYNENIVDGVAGFFSNGSGWPTLELDQAGSGRVLDMQNNGTGDGTGSGDFLAAFNLNTELMFRVGGKGDVWTKGGYYTLDADMAEMLPAVEGVEPGDVLVISPDGKLTRSTAAYQVSVMGVYSTRPGFVGGQDIPGAIQLAVVGVVPVKVSAENGPILPGDLLVTSATAGHAMKAGPNPPQGTVIGKALAGLDEGAGVIKMLATLQ